MSDPTAVPAGDPRRRWNQRVIERHADQVVAGEHDGECEWRATGHFLCHCAKRVRIAAGLIAPPAIGYRTPVCLGCSGDLASDGDGWTCEPCHARWSHDASDGDQGEFTDDYGVLDPDAA